MKIFNKESNLVRSWDLLSPSIELLKSNIWSVLYMAFLPGLFLSVGAIMLKTFPTHIAELQGSRLIGALIMAIALLVLIVAFPGYCYMQSQAAQGRHVETGQSFMRGLRFLPSMIVLFILIFVFVEAGTFLFIIPGLIILRAFSLAPFFVVDKSLSPLAALKASALATRPVSAWIWGTYGVLFTLIFISLIPSLLIPIYGSILGSIVIYLYSFAVALRYNEIVNKVNPQQFNRHSDTPDSD